MKSTGIIRPVDKMGRVVIPKEIRKQLKVENDIDSFEIYMEDDKIILKGIKALGSLLFFVIFHSAFITPLISSAEHRL